MCRQVLSRIRTRVAPCAVTGQVRWHERRSNCTVGALTTGSEHPGKAGHIGPTIGRQPGQQIPQALMPYAISRRALGRVLATEERPNGLLHENRHRAMVAHSGERCEFFNGQRRSGHAKYAQERQADPVPASLRIQVPRIPAPAFHLLRVVAGQVSGEPAHQQRVSRPVPNLLHHISQIDPYPATSLRERPPEPPEPDAARRQDLGQLPITRLGIEDISDVPAHVVKVVGTLNVDLLPVGGLAHRV